MKELSVEEKKAFIEKHVGKEIFFKNYYKYKFYYEFVDESGLKYLLACGDVTKDIYRDCWHSVEKIGQYLGWGDEFVSDIYVDEVKK